MGSTKGLTSPTAPPSTYCTSPTGYDICSHLPFMVIGRNGAALALNQKWTRARLAKPSVYVG